VRYGADTGVRIKAWPSNPEFAPTAEDIAYFEANPS
jgi:hypothetical protein